MSVIRRYRALAEFRVPYAITNGRPEMEGWFRELNAAGFGLLQPRAAADAKYLDLVVGTYSKSAQIGR
jgi:hypothetical protein